MFVLSDGFSWRDGSPVNFLNWNKGEPSDAMSSSQEECVEMYTDSGKWNDVTCFTKRRYVCKKTARMYRTMKELLICVTQRKNCSYILHIENCSYMYILHTENCSYVLHKERTACRYSTKRYITSCMCRKKKECSYGIRKNLH